MSEYPQPGLHPDADTLNAFVEGVLPEHERLACLDHFAGCASCREVVYLAQEPLTQDPLPVPATDSAAWWKRWLKPIPVLGVAATAGIIVFSVALYRPDKPAQRTPAVTVAMSPPQAANEPLTPASPPVMKAREAPLNTMPLPAPKPAPHPATPPNSSQPASARVLSRPQVSLDAPQRSAFMPAAPAPVPARVATLDAVAPAQSAIAGTVTDPSGAAIARPPGSGPPSIRRARRQSHQRSLGAVLHRRAPAGPVRIAGDQCGIPASEERNRGPKGSGSPGGFVAVNRCGNGNGPGHSQHPRRR